MTYVKTLDRTQMMMMVSLDNLVSPESTARLIDAFVDSLDLEELGIKGAIPSTEGRPSYNPVGLLKLYIYGYKNQIRSSRKLMDSCSVNIEVKWLMNGAEPDFRTIALFRKDNIEKLKTIFHEFNIRISGKIPWGFTSIDGSKIMANNSKDRNFTLNKLDDRIAWLDMHSSEYLRKLDELDKDEEEDPTKLTRDELEEKIKELSQRKELYESYRQHMIDKNLTQISLTDIDSKLMKNKNGMAVCYNPQTAVDSETHIIKDFVMTNNPTDHGQLMPTMEKIRQDNEGEILQVVADKGYNKPEDMRECLENGIIPNVICPNKSGVYEVEIPYEESTSCNPNSTIPSEIKECLRAGVVPEAYKEIISDIKIVEARKKVFDDTIEESVISPYGSVQEMKERAAEGYFVFNPNEMVVYCPAGEQLRKKSISQNGMILFSNKFACNNCQFKDKCGRTNSGFKTVEFNKNTLEKPNRRWLDAEKKMPEPLPVKQRNWHYEKNKIVRFIFTPYQKLMDMRKCLSEHPFGTIKRWMGAYYFLMRGLKNVNGEFALMCLGYNIERAKNLFGFQTLLNMLTTKTNY